MSDFLGKWTIVQKTPIGNMEMEWVISQDGESYKFQSTSSKIIGEPVSLNIDGDKLVGVMKLTKPFPVELEISGTLTSPTSFEGRGKSGKFPPAPIVAKKHD